MIKRARRRAKAWSFPLIRDVILFVAGLAGLGYETIFTKVDRPTLLLLYAAMLGLPAFLNANNDRASDEKEIAELLARRRRRSDDYDDDDDYEYEDIDIDADPDVHRISHKRRPPRDDDNDDDGDDNHGRRHTR